MTKSFLKYVFGKTTSFFVILLFISSFASLSKTQLYPEEKKGEEKFKSLFKYKIQKLSIYKYL